MRLDRYRKSIGYVAAALAEIVALWIGAPTWLLGLIPVLGAVAGWGLPNALTAQQERQVLQAYHSK